jgi:hypothetical protein
MRGPLQPYRASRISHPASRYFIISSFEVYSWHTLNIGLFNHE